MVEKIKTYNDINEALNNYEYKFDSTENNPLGTNKYWIFVKYQGRVFYELSDRNPNENKELKNVMINNIKEQILEYKNDIEI